MTTSFVPPSDDLATCIAVINETSISATIIQDQWITFQNAYPNRTFWLLQPEGYPVTDLKVPLEYTNDPKANGPVTVNEDNGVVAQRSDWFAICDLTSLPTGSTVALAVDQSGSLRTSNVQASYDYFKLRVADAGLVLYELPTTGLWTDEGWPTPFYVVLPGPEPEPTPPRGLIWIKDSTDTWKNVQRMWYKTASDTWTPVQTGWYKKDSTTWKQIYPSNEAIIAATPGYVYFTAYTDATSSSARVNLTNTGDGDANIQSIIAGTSSFYGVNIDTTGLAGSNIILPGRSKYIDLSITTTSTSGSKVVPITITYDSGSAIGLKQTLIQLTGTSQARFSAVSVSPSSVSYSTTSSNAGNPPSKTITVSNTGNGGILTVANITSDNGTTVGAISSNTISSGSSATFTITAPADQAVGTYNDTITIVTSAGTRTIPVTYSVTAFATIAVLPQAVSYESMINTPRPTSAITVYNEGDGASLRITSITSSTGNTLINLSSFSTVIASGSSSAFEITPVTGLGVGTYNDTLTIVSDAGNVDIGVTYQVTPYIPGSIDYTNPGTYIFTIPDGVVTISASVYGAGGGGGGFYGNGDNHAGGGGGSGGYLLNQTINVTPGEQLTVIVGASGKSASAEFNGNFFCIGTAYGTSGPGSTYSDGTSGGTSLISRGSTTLTSATGGEGAKGAGPGDTMGESRSGVGGSPNGVTGATPDSNRNHYNATAGGNNGTGYGTGGNGNGPAGTGICPAEGGAGRVYISW